MEGAMADAVVVMSTNRSKDLPPQPRSMNEIRISPESKSPLRHSVLISQDLFKRVNSNRRLCGSSQLQWSEMLCEAANFHNIEMGSDGKSQSEFDFGQFYTEMILRLIAGSGQNFLSEKRTPSKISKNLMKLWMSRSSWNDIMLDPIMKYCAIAVAVNETRVYCTAIFSMYEAFKFPPMMGNTAYVDYSQRMRVQRPIDWNAYSEREEYSFNRHRREQHESRRPVRVEPMFCCDIFVALKSLFYRCFPDNEIEEIGGALYDSRPEIELEP